MPPTKITAQMNAIAFMGCLSTVGGSYYDSS